MNFFEGFSNFLRTCSALFHVNWRWWAGGATTTIVVTIVQAFRDPAGAVNRFLIICIDLILPFFPSTPNSFKLTTLANQFISSIPQQVGSGVVSEILSGIFGMLSIYLVYKLYKTIPFIS